MYQKKKPVVAFDVIDLAVELDWTSGSGQVALMNRMKSQKNFQIAIIKALLLKMKNERRQKHLGLELFVRRNHKVWYNGTMYRKKKQVVAFDVIDLAVELDWTSGSGQVMLFRFACAQIKKRLFFAFAKSNSSGMITGY
jgi:hypothetical protein